LGQFFFYFCNVLCGFPLLAMGKAKTGLIESRWDRSLGVWWLLRLIDVSNDGEAAISGATNSLLLTIQQW